MDNERIEIELEPPETEIVPMEIEKK